MNQLGYAAASLGNHEFNYGLPFLRTALAGASFPVVTSNVFVAGPDRAAAPSLIKPFVLLDREFVDEAGATQRLRIGVIGFVPPQVMYLTCGPPSGTSPSAAISNPYRW